MGLSPIRAAKARHSLAEVAGRTGIHVPSGGRSVTVHCPMPAHGHYDRTPSMRLHLDDGIWCCFGCTPSKPGGGLRGGDVIDWVRQTEQVSDWRDVIRILDSGQTLSNAWVNGEFRSRPVRAVGESELPDLSRSSACDVQEAVKAAWEFYQAPPLHELGRRYLAGRRIDIRLLERFNGRTEVGHTPNHPSGLVNHLRSQGISDDLLVDAALAHRRLGEKRLTDFYRERVLVPVRSTRGPVVGLVGRNVGDVRWPKYKNPPGTAIYDKSAVLYRPLRIPMHAQSRVLVVEGTLDALAVACAAVHRREERRLCPVTQSGKELSAQQIRAILTGHHGPIVIAFDGDPPGQESTRRLRMRFRNQGFDTESVALPEGMDPASWLAREGGDGVEVFLTRDPTASRSLHSSASCGGERCQRQPTPLV